jgi:hypothetical protein
VLVCPRARVERPDPVAVIAVALAMSAGPAVAKTPRVPCPGGRFVVQGGPMLPGAPATEVDVIEVVPGSGTLSIGCSAADLASVPCRVGSARDRARRHARLLTPVAAGPQCALTRLKRLV